MGVRQREHPFIRGRWVRNPNQTSLTGGKVDSVKVVDKVKTEDRHRMKGKIRALIVSEI